MGDVAGKNTAFYDGTDSATLHLINIPSSLNDNQYHCVVDGITSNLIKLKFINSWIGGSSSSWMDPLNWSCGVLPDENTSVLLYGGTILLGANATCKTLNVGGGAKFTILPGYTLTITH